MMCRRSSKLIQKIYNVNITLACSPMFEINHKSKKVPIFIMYIPF